MSNALAVLASRAVDWIDATTPSSELCEWLADAGWNVRLTPLAGDVSSRRYFRVENSPGGNTAILALYPEVLLPACSRFLRTSQLLTGMGVPVPEVLAQDCELGFMLVSDLGDNTLYDGSLRPWSEIAPFFERAMELQGLIEALPVSEVEPLLPRLDHELLLRELRQTWDCFLMPQGLVGASAEAERWWELLDGLCAELGKAVPSPCHRDFMVRNLVPKQGDKADLWVLDHQDLRLGPPFYDLASLLNDSLFPPDNWTHARLTDRLKTELDHRAFHLVAAQRTLKAVGTYAAFAARGMRRHLPLIRPTLDRAVFHLQHLPQTRPLLPAFRDRLASRTFC